MIGGTTIRLAKAVHNGVVYHSDSTKVGSGRQAVLASRLRRGSAALVLLRDLLCLGICFMCAAPAMAAPAVEIFGPGPVNCQMLGGDEADCLLSVSLVTESVRNEASFSLTTLPLAERVLFRKWCLHPADECVVTIQGQREAPQSTRLATVTSLQWQRPRTPKNESAAAP